MTYNQYRAPMAHWLSAVNWLSSAASIGSAPGIRFPRTIQKPILFCHLYRRLQHRQRLAIETISKYDTM